MRSEGDIGEGWEAFRAEISRAHAEAAAEPVDLPTRDAAGNVVWHRYFGLRIVGLERKKAPAPVREPGPREV